jgi:ABC-2 type transport system ATP-binding protein
MIEVRGFSKTYDQRTAVRALSFTVQPGEVLGLVGPNGAGKTTTLRALAGIHAPTTGSLLIAGHDVVREAIAAKSKLALIPDDPQLFASLTVWEHLVFTAQVYRVEPFAERAAQLLERFELLDRRDTLADELSRGMRQKVAVACALLHEPDALLLDEPMTGLDPRGIRTLFEAVRARAEAGAAVVISSHLLGQIDPLCTSFLVLRAGERLFFGSRSEIHRAMPGLREDASLEEIFFEITEGRSGA